MIVGYTHSKVVPYAATNRHVLQMAQLASVSSRFPIVRKAMLFGKSSTPIEVSSIEHIYREYPETILHFPRLCGFPLSDPVRRCIAAYFHTNYPDHTFYTWLEFIPEYCERWGKLRIPDGGDSIRCAAVVGPPLAIWQVGLIYIFQKDANENYPCRCPRMIDAFGYGRLDFILALVLPVSEEFGIDEPKLHLLAHITEAKGTEGDARTEFISFAEFGRSVILDITSVQRLVGRVRTEGNKPSGEWYIIDQCLDLCETVFHPPEHEHEDH
ncbi:hypothetical protein OPQ81_008609 [Rhizoctonia solani]|nr:hypothetical protein OPQ81_008609 [Rhizoctonia solani]